MYLMFEILGHQLTVKILPDVDHVLGTRNPVMHVTETVSGGLRQ